jgi:hypothetical protein
VTRTPVFSLLLLALSACARPASVVSTPHPASGSAVLETEDRWYAALVARDTVTLSPLLAPEFVVSGSDPELESRATYLQTVQMPDRTLEPVVLEDRQVRIYGETAVSTGRAKLRGRWRERPIALEFRFTNVYVLREGRWQAVASQVSVIG